MALNTATRYSYDPAAYAKAQAASKGLESSWAQENARLQADMAATDARARRSGGMGANTDWSARIAALNALSQRSQAANQATAAVRQDPEKESWQQIQDATLGRGDAIESDPRITAALDALNPAQAQANYYAQASDATAAQAGANADMLRQQFAAAGIGLNDPAAQARLRQTETARMQGNNAALGQAQQAGQAAAGQSASIRLAQMGQATQSYNQGAAYLSQKDWGTGQNQSAGYSTTVPRAPAVGQGNAGVVNSQPAWQPTADASGSPAVAAQGNTRVQTPGMSVADRNAAQSAWAVNQPAAVSTYNRGSIQVNGQDAAAEAARKRLQQQQTGTGAWDQSTIYANG